MDLRGSYCGKRSFSELQSCQWSRNDDEEMPVKKKLRTKLVDLFNRVSMNMTKPEEHMKVFLRIKPFTKDEDASQRCLEVHSEDNTVVATAPELSHTYKSMKRGLAKASHKFTFSHIFPEDTTQREFFNDTMLSMTKDFISGQNSLVFTYGVTSSGKTYTIQGQPQDAGILPRCLDVIFNSINGKQMTGMTLKPRMFTDVVRLSTEEVNAEKKIKEKTLRMSVEDDTTVMALLGDEMESVLSDTATSSTSGSVDEILPEVENRDREELKVDVEDQGKILFGIWVSFAEIYNEQIFDLLEPMPRKKNARRPVLKICDDKNGNPYIKGLKEINVDSADEAYRLLTIGQRNLQTACTRLNHCSSRSHCIFNIKIVRVVDKEDPHIARVSMLSLCDLAGSERYSRTQATGDRLKEAGNINTSLMTLGRCIETLRHNQLHKDKQRLVPFRDSKLTRLLTNFFNGCGRAAMIVNVSQCVTMFDDTLHAFKFSAIAKQVKYIEKPPEPPKLPKPKLLHVPPPQRSSIAWETQEPTENENRVVSEAQNLPLPEDDEDEEDLSTDEDDDEACSTPEQKSLNEMRAYIKTLEMRNERLVEMLEEEMSNASKIESRVRQEVTQAMMKQIVNIEETYSAILKETNEEAQELADERVKGIMAVYEQRLERIQRKVDEDDEWVSSLLFHQEQVKVEERDAKIKELEEELSKLKTEHKNCGKKSADDSVDIGNSMLIETLTQKLQEATDSSKAKDEKIDELESLISEAGEVYKKHVEEISKLKEVTKQQEEEMQKQVSSIEELKKQVKEGMDSCDDLKKTLRNKEMEWKTTEEQLTRKINSQELTVSSLQEECKELQEEIERLQDQMSQIDEESRLESLHSDHKELAVELDTVKENHTKSLNELKASKSTVDKLSKDLEASSEHGKHLEEEIRILKQEKDKLTTDAESLTQLNKELTTKVLSLESKLSEVVSTGYGTNGMSAEDVNITDMVRQIEQKSSPAPKMETSATLKTKPMDESDDSEIVFNPKSVAAAKVQETPKLSKSLETSRVSGKTASDSACEELALKLKESELANAALRKKLKREEDDFFKREQALIHGYTAEIDNLKYELAKLKCKTDASGRLRPLRSKRKGTGMDTSSSSAMSDSVCDTSAIAEPKPVKNGEEISEKEKQVDILSSELALVKQQLLSLSAAYNKLQTGRGGNETNSFIQDVVMGTPGKHQSTLGVFCSENNATDSVLQFEIEEYAIKMDEMKMKIAQQDDELKTSKAALEKMKMEKKEAENNVQIMQLKRKEESDNKSTEETNAREDLEQKLKDAGAAKAAMESENEDMKTMVGQLKETLETAISFRNGTEQKLVDVTSELELNRQRLHELEEREKELQQVLETLTAERDDLKCQIQNLNGDMNRDGNEKQKLEVELQRLQAHAKNADTDKSQMEQTIEQLKKKLESLQEELSQVKKVHCEKDVKLTELMREKQTLEEGVKTHEEELQLCKKKLLTAEGRYNETKDLLEQVTHAKSDIHSKLQTVSDALTAKEEALKKQEKDHETKMMELKQQYCNEGETKSETISKLQQLVEDSKAKLKAKTTELEKVECQRQEDAAEVSQKLLTLEREKKIAERKAAEAKEREQEWQSKCQGLDRMKQLEQQLHEQLKTAASTVRKHYEKTSELKEELALSNKERDQLKEELASLKTSNEKVQELERKTKELEQSLSSEKEQRLQAQQSIQEYHDKIDILKKGFLESEETMEQQEKIIKEQDDDLESLRDELHTITAEKERLDRLVTRKELETANLNKQVSKLEADVKNMRQLERKAVEVEQREKLSNDQLQQSNSERGLLNDRIHKLEMEKQSLEHRLENAEKQTKAERKSLEELEEKLHESEKQKRELDREVKRVTDDKKTLDEKLAKVNKQKDMEEARCGQLEVELKLLKKETEKESSEKSKYSKLQDDLERENKDLKVERLQLRQDIESKQSELQELQNSLKEATENLKSLEKEVQKQERINKRNREEMETWKQERDTCVNKLEQLISKRQQENKQLIQENEHLKKDNSDLAKNVSNITSMKDSVIADLKKANNTLSIRLAAAQGKSPPPKIATPDDALRRMEFVEDLDTTGHLEMDATPPIAAKKCRKRQNSLRQSQSSVSSSSVDPEAFTTPVRKSLKPIEEQNENSPRAPSVTTSSSKSALQAATGRVAELASEVISSISPLTRSAKRQQERGSKKNKKKTSIQAPFEPVSYVAIGDTQNENTLPQSTRKSSRLRSKQTIDYRETFLS